MKRSTELVQVIAIFDKDATGLKKQQRMVIDENLELNVFVCSLIGLPLLIEKPIFTDWSVHEGVWLAKTEYDNFSKELASLAVNRPEIIKKWFDKLVGFRDSFASEAPSFNRANRIDDIIKEYCKFQMLVWAAFLCTETIVDAYHNWLNDNILISPDFDKFPDLFIKTLIPLQDIYTELYLWPVPNKDGFSLKPTENIAHFGHGGEDFFIDGNLLTSLRGNARKQHLEALKVIESNTSRLKYTEFIGILTGIQKLQYMKECKNELCVVGKKCFTRSIKMLTDTLTTNGKLNYKWALRRVKEICFLGCNEVSTSLKNSCQDYSILSMK